MYESRGQLWKCSVYSTSCLNSFLFLSQLSPSTPAPYYRTLSTRSQTKKRGLEPNNTTSQRNVPSGTLEREGTCTDKTLKGTEIGPMVSNNTKM